MVSSGGGESKPPAEPTVYGGITSGYILNKITGILVAV